MDAKMAERMSALTSAFYERMAQSFSNTRECPWPGWDVVERLLDTSDRNSLSLLDVACGNLRYERYLRAHVSKLDVWCCDNCMELVTSTGPLATGVHFHECDIARLLMDSSDLGWDELPLCDRCVSFGFMHHLPLFRQRVHLLDLLVRKTKPQGFIVVTFWQFLRDARLRAKARPVEGAGEYDFLLGWQDVPDVWRFCHHATDEEIDVLVEDVSELALEVTRFSADGRDGDLNRYLVLRRI